MKAILTLIPLLSLFFTSNIFAGETAGLQVGEIAPDFNLKNIDGKKVALSSYTDVEGVLLIFSCNHCPYVKLYENRMNALEAKYHAQGFPVVAINPNDPIRQPEDSFEKMQENAKAKNFKFPYLLDEDQSVAKAYGASRTPHVYLLKANEAGQFHVAYIGAIDNDTEGRLPEAERVNYVADAIAAIKKGQEPNPSLTKAIGCTIKWSKK